MDSVSNFMWTGHKEIPTLLLNPLGRVTLIHWRATNREKISSYPDHLKKEVKIHF
jgi:hypothetical protein